jgi:hypothetical protein
MIPRWKRWMMRIVDASEAYVDSRGAPMPQANRGPPSGGECKNAHDGEREEGGAYIKGD